MKGLSRGAIATGLLEGVKADTKTRGFYTSLAPSMKVKPTSSCDGIDMVSMAREQTSFAQARVVVVCPEPPPGRPLINTGDARQSIESQPVHTRIPVGISLFLTYNTSYTSGRFTATDSKPTIGLGPSPAYTTNEVNPAQVGRFTPSGNIPNS